MSSLTALDTHYLASLVTDADDVLLLQDAVYGGIVKDDNFATLLQRKSIGLYLLKEDLDARGITQLIDTRFSLVSYDQFVELTVKHSKQITW